MEKGDIVLVKFPFSDQTDHKLRPAVVLIPEDKFGDICFAFIGSNIDLADEKDFIVKKRSQLIKGSGLKVTSVVRLNKIVSLNKSSVEGRIGKFNKKALDNLNKSLSVWFQI